MALVASLIPPDSATTPPLGSTLGCTLGGHPGHVCAPSISAAVPATAHTGLPPHSCEQARAHAPRAVLQPSHPSLRPAPASRGHCLPVRSPNFHWVRLVRTVMDGAVPQLSRTGKRRGRGDLLCLLLLSTRDVIQKPSEIHSKNVQRNFPKKHVLQEFISGSSFAMLCRQVARQPPPTPPPSAEISREGREDAQAPGPGQAWLLLAPEPVGPPCGGHSRNPARPQFSRL